MSNLRSYLAAAKASAEGLEQLNKALSFLIPFNKPHLLQVEEVADEGLSVRLPFIEENLNHVGGIHACALATLAEFCSGLCLYAWLDVNEYRLIMKELQVEYVYQAKKDVFAVFSFSKEELQEKVLGPLHTEDAVLLALDVPVVDEDNTLICKAKITWQIKPWAKVRTAQA